MDKWECNQQLVSMISTSQHHDLEISMIYAATPPSSILTWTNTYYIAADQPVSYILPEITPIPTA